MVWIVPSLLGVYVKTARSSSTIMLPGFSLVSRWPVSQSVFSTQSIPSLPCLCKWVNRRSASINWTEEQKCVGVDKLTFSKMSRFVDKVCVVSLDAISNRILPVYRVSRCYVFWMLDAPNAFVSGLLWISFCLPAPTFSLDCATAREILNLFHSKSVCVEKCHEITYVSARPLRPVAPNGWSFWVSFLNSFINWSAYER